MSGGGGGSAAGSVGSGRRLVDWAGGVGVAGGAGLVGTFSPGRLGRTANCECGSTALAPAGGGGSVTTQAGSGPADSPTRSRRTVRRGAVIRDLGPGNPPAGRARGPGRIPGPAGRFKATSGGEQLWVPAAEDPLTRRPSSGDPPRVLLPPN